MVKKKEPLILKNATVLVERGESAIFNFSSASHQGVIELPVEKLRPWAGQPRTYFSPEAMSQLVSSVKKNGIHLPLLVRPHEDFYEVVAGERRFRASLEAGLAIVPAVIRELDDEQALEAALSENLDREDLNPIEEVDALLKLLSVRLSLAVSEVPPLLYEMKRDWEKVPKESRENVFPAPDNCQYLTVIATFAAYGKNWYSFICSQLKLKNLPEDLYEAIAQGRIEYTKGLKFKALKDEQQRRDLLKEALAQNWSIREISERIKQLAQERETPAAQPTQRVTALSGLIKKSRLWETDPKTWQKIEGYFQKIESLIQVSEEEPLAQEGKSA